MASKIHAPPSIQIHAQVHLPFSPEEPGQKACHCHFDGTHTVLCIIHAMVIRSSYHTRMNDKCKKVCQWPPTRSSCLLNKQTPLHLWRKRESTNIDILWPLKRPPGNLWQQISSLSLYRPGICQLHTRMTYLHLARILKDKSCLSNWLENEAPLAKSASPDLVIELVTFYPLKSGCAR